MRRRTNAHHGEMKNTNPSSSVADQSPVVPSGLQAALRVSRNVMVLTGAGISSESGIPTFRDALTGIWTHHNPQQLATRAGFRKDPSLVWGWYESRRHAVTQVSPNSGHHALVDLAKLHGVESVKIVTQNVDDLHERAGSTDVVHLHGSLFAPRCMTCGRFTTFAELGSSSTVLDRPLEPPR